jgi:RNA polymerase sigma-70 factor (ECF subfamily)
MVESSLVDARVPEAINPDARNDQQLIAAINDGDSAAFDVLYFRYREWVVRLACRFTGDNDSALDVLQETFLYLLKKFPGFRLTANLKTFLYPAVRNLSIAARRKAARCQANDEDKVQIEQLTAAPQSSIASGPGDIAVVLAGLPEDHREVLLLRFVDGLSLAEIAGATAVPLGTVKSRLHYALETLRQDARTKEFFEQ